uniref:Phage protein D n=2 Tax=Tolypothrix TaxID=111782 RepID=A0A0C1RPE2_9CYAN
MLKPTFSLTIGSIKSSTDIPTLGVNNLVIERDMDIPVDGLRLQMMELPNIVIEENIVVELGYDFQQTKVFTGNVIRIRPAIVGIEICALGKMNRLLNFRTSATFQDKSVGSIAQDLIRQAGLSAGSIDNEITLPRYVVDSRMSAFAHLKELAERLGYELYCDREGHVKFHAPDSSPQSDTGGGESYVFGQHLLKAVAQLTPTAWGKIEVGGESPMSGKGDSTAHWLTVNDEDYRGSAGEVDSPRLLMIEPLARTQDLANRFARGRLAVAKRKAYEVCFTVLGSPLIDLNDSISIKNVPKESINSSGYVRAIRHQFGETVGFVTDLRISMGGKK